MKVHFNKPNKRYTNKISFDNNTTFGIGNVQPLFCKQLAAGSKCSVNFSQLTRLSPLVVPTFARLKQRNDFAFVPIGLVMPSFDAFLSHSLIQGTVISYTPNSVPCTTNSDLFLCLTNSSLAAVSILDGNEFAQSAVSFTNSYHKTISRPNQFELNKPTIDQYPITFWDFVLTKTSQVADNSWQNLKIVVKLRAAGRYWLSVLRGLGYTCDPEDRQPVSILPLWAFAKAYYDLYYPKRSNPWHASNYYADINNFYNGKFVLRDFGSLTYNMVSSSDVLHSLFGSDVGFDFFASIDDSLVTVATDLPINESSLASPNNTFNNANWDENPEYERFAVSPTVNGQPQEHDNASYVPALSTEVIPSENKQFGISADQLRLVDKLWNFVQKSSVVGQNVKDWFAVHLGVKPNDDMFDQTILVDSVVNDVSINTVVSTAQTTDVGKGDNLGALAGQGYASQTGSLSCDAKTFGFFMCLSSIVPISGVSCGTQPELYQNTLYEQQLPDFDGIGYEVLNKSSFEESIVAGNENNHYNLHINGGFGYVPRLSSWKSLHNIRSGNFAVNSVKDSLLPYNVDVLPTEELTASVLWRFPWAQPNRFVSFNRMFYNVAPSGISNLPLVAPLDDNFMCQTAFDLSYTSYLKPLSDSYSVECLGKDLVSVKEQ